MVNGDPIEGKKSARDTESGKNKSGAGPNESGSAIRSSFLLSRRGTLASLLGASGLSLLSTQASAADGDSQGQNSVSVSVSQYTHTVTFPNPELGFLFGRDVALSADGTTALIGAPENNPGADYPNGIGEAYIFRQTEVGWDITDPVRLPNPDPDTFDLFGRSVALSADGATALVGAPFDVPDDDYWGVGEIYVFRRTEMGWNASNPVTLSHPKPDTDDHFGQDVALSADGTTALVGTPGEFAHIGEAYVFRRTEAGWETTDPVTLPNPDPDWWDSFGEAVALSANGANALIGAPDVTSDAGERIGEAYIFRRTEMGWNTTDPVRLPNPAPDTFDEFGSSVALNAEGDTALISAPSLAYDPDEEGESHAEADAGEFMSEVYVFERTSEGWNTTDPVLLSDPHPESFDSFGDALALSADGNTALVGAPSADVNGIQESGKAYVFSRTEDGWNTSEPLVLSNPEPGWGDLFGWAVALSANGATALVSALLDSRGKTYLFERGIQPLIFDDQISSGDVVTISSVTMPEGGFVVIASADGDTIYGVSEYLSPGTTTDLQVTLDTPLSASGTYLASGQADTNENRQFDAPRVLDVCQLAADEIDLLDTAEITIQ